MRTFSLYVMPLIGGGFLFLYPALMQVAFSFTAILGLVQAMLFRKPWIRAKLGIHPLPTKKPKTPYSVSLTRYEAPAPPTSTNGISSDGKPGGLISSLRSKARNLVSRPAAGVIKGVQQYQGTAAPNKKRHGRTPKELLDAQKYEERHRRQQTASQQSNRKGAK